MSQERPVVLFLCTHNRCRSQIAAGILRHLCGSSVVSLSAGSSPADHVHPLAVDTLMKRGIDIRDCRPKLVREAIDGIEKVDFVITLCSNDGDICPRLPSGVKVGHRIHRMFDDPSVLDEADQATAFEKTCDEVEKYLREEILPMLAPLSEEQPISVPVPVTASEVIVKGEEIEGGVLGSATEVSTSADESADVAKISFFEKYLSVWVLLCMACGTLIGYFAPSSVAALKRAEFFKISVPIAVLLWLMIFPMLLQIDFAAVRSAVRNPGPIFLTTLVNYAVQPFTMYGVALLFFRYVYAGIMDPDVAQEYLAGAILLGGAPCTAMVFVWSLLVGGSPGYTLMQVAVNDSLMLVLYLPTMLLLLSASSIPLPYEVIAFSVALFIAAPLFLAMITRTWLIKHRGMDYLNNVIEVLKPVTPVGLLLTLVLIFIYQGETIGRKPLDIVLIAIPLSIQTFVIFGITLSMGYLCCLDYTVACPAALISTSNFFELAVAIAISLYGPESGASLATVVGVLVEVPLMLTLVEVCKRVKPRFIERCDSCDEKCKVLRDVVNFKVCATGCGGGTGQCGSVKGDSIPIEESPQPAEP